MQLTKKIADFAGVELQFDAILSFASVALLVLGYLMVCSASLHLGLKGMNNIFHYPIRQFIHIFLGLAFGFCVYLTPLSLWEKYSQLLFFVGLFFLLIVFIPGLGVKVNGSVRWLSIGGLRIQVSEVMKLIVVVYMAGFITRHQNFVQESVHALVRPLMLLSSACILLLLEPDMGSAVVILTIAMGVMFLAGAQMKQFIALILGVVIIGVFAISLSEYRSKRVSGFLHPWEDPFGDSFQLVQALIAFGQGEWFGKGLGGGVQKMFYLPEAHTDFLFSVLGEELGLIGIFSVISLFTLIVWRAFSIALIAENLNKTFHAFIAYGLGIWFGFQSFVNMGVNMGILPTKGLTLPFMSYGGGSMIVMCASMALLFRVSGELNMLENASSREKHYV